MTSDDPEQLLAELIPGYLAVAPANRHAARIAHAERDLERMQQRVLTAYGSEDCDDAELDVLLDTSASRQVPDLWSAPVPLLLIDAHFSDESGGPRPREAGGRIVWLETGDTDSYLRSLAVAGEIFLVIREDAVAAGARGGSTRELA
ncbi:hypothetical protein [Actinoplanes derwentensis]|uniref:Uncharacterized protein n=1 Tax=Actinoplanes derwentensis TaxID=113562 RepID=A0A1H2C985_9ACTN|nr:hypothetical protein [Actinoplanes derwentensis]GID86530.1 hypothetical protein Ade03nite_54540 [Actinoplanes derwentensis]SDT66626.1 hypothetical protein SAMN04489716_5370 [Actinoplanes derwentensis]